MAEKDGCALFLVYRNSNTGNILHTWSGITGQKDVLAGVWYSLNKNGDTVVV